MQVGDKIRANDDPNQIGVIIHIDRTGQNPYYKDRPEKYNVVIYVKSDTSWYSGKDTATERFFEQHPTVPNKYMNQYLYWDSAVHWESNYEVIGHVNNISQNGNQSEKSDDYDMRFFGMGKPHVRGNSGLEFL